MRITIRLAAIHHLADAGAAAQTMNEPKNVTHGSPGFPATLGALGHHVERGRSGCGSRRAPAVARDRGRWRAIPALARGRGELDDARRAVEEDGDGDAVERVVLDCATTAISIPSSASGCWSHVVTRSPSRSRSLDHRRREHLHAVVVLDHAVLRFLVGCSCESRGPLGPRAPRASASSGRCRSHD